MKKRIVTSLTAAFVVLAALQAEAQTEILLGSVGNLAAANLYVTYLAIGTLADAQVDDVYDSETVRLLLEDIGTFVQRSKRWLEETQASGALKDADIALVDEMVSIYGLLIAEAAAFVAYMETGAWAAYDDYRRQAWAKIAALLRIQVDDSQSPE